MLTKVNPENTKTNVKIPAEPKKTVSLDFILREIGEFGRFQWLLEFLFAIMLIQPVSQIFVIVFVTSDTQLRCRENSSVCRINGTFSSKDEHHCKLARSEWEFVESKDHSFITQFDIYCERKWVVQLASSIFFLGWAMGSILLGWAADRYGRKTVLFPSLLACMVLSGISPFLPSLSVFVVVRFLIGMCIPGTSLQMFIIMSEVVGERHRLKSGLIIWFANALAVCLIGVKAYFIRDWKILYLVCTAPYVVTLLFYKMVPESPQWLILKKRQSKALIIFQKIAKFNGKQLDDKFSIEEKKENGKTSKVRFMTADILHKTAIQGFGWMVSGMLFFGLSLSVGQLGGSAHINFILVSLVEIPALFIAIFLGEKIGRKRIVLIPLFIGGIACGLISLFQHEICVFPAGSISITLGKIILALIGKLFVTITFDSFYTWSAELYPTELRGKGMGLCQVSSLLGATISPWLVNGFKLLHVSSPFIVLCGFAVTSTIALTFLPETQNQIKKTLVIENLNISGEKKKQIDEKV